MKAQWIKLSAVTLAIAAPLSGASADNSASSETVQTSLAELDLASGPMAIDALLNSGDDAEAYDIAARGAQAGAPELTGYLGWFHDTGRHVTLDASKAAEIYAAGAELGDAYSQWRLGVMIDEGTAAGTMDQALTLFRKAAGQKHVDALVSLAVMHASGRGVDVDYVAAMRYYQAAALRGNAHGLQGIGIMHANGEGVPADFDEAMAHWIVAAAAGNEAADALLTTYFTPLGDEASIKVLTRADTLARLYGVNLSFEVAGSAEAGNSGT